jgi:hypothetical protein
MSITDGPNWIDSLMTPFSPPIQAYPPHLRGPSSSFTLSSFVSNLFKKLIWTPRKRREEVVCEIFHQTLMCTMHIDLSKLCALNKHKSRMHTAPRIRLIFVGILERERENIGFSFHGCRYEVELFGFYNCLNFLGIKRE